MTTDKSIPQSMRDWGLDANKLRLKRDELAEQIKQEEADYENARLAHLMNVMEPDQYKKWSSSSTPSSARQAIEIQLLTEHPLTWRMSINQMKLDLAGAEKKYRDARTQYEFYANLAWRPVFDVVGERMYGLPAGLPEQMPHVVPTMPATLPVPLPVASGGKSPWD